MREPVFFTCDLDEERLLHTDPDEAIEEYLDCLGELPESVTVYGFARTEVGEAFRERQGRKLLEVLLESLDEIFGDPNEATLAPPPEPMNLAARTFVDSVLDHYSAWACDEVTKEAINVRE